MNWKKTVLLAGAVISLAGCNDTEICHIYIPDYLNISYDWSHGEAPDGNDQVTLVITGEDGGITTLTPVDGTDIQLYMGDYKIVAANPPADITYDNGYKVGVNVADGLAAEPSAAFGAGEAAATIIKNVIPEELEIEMMAQTRVLIVEIVFENAAGHHMDEAGRFKAKLNNVTVSRDISQGFPPKAVARQTELPSYADFLLRFARAGNGGAADDLVFRASHRLLGMGTERKDLLFEYYDGDVAASQLRFLTLEGVDLDDFHTRQPVSEPFVLRIRLTAGAVSGAWEIKDWETGTGDDMIAVEQ